MSETLINTWSLLVIAGINLAIAVLTWRTHKLATRTNENIATVERATNSMKDALVAATAKASFAEGADSARIAGEEKAAQLIKTPLTKTP